MCYAFTYGADAVHVGQPRYPLRVCSDELSHEDLQLDINETHALGKKFYVMVNIAPYNAKLKTFIHDLKPVVEMGLGALIISDPSLIMLVWKHSPEMLIHLSVQANAVNQTTVKFRQQMELTRVILSRELSLDEIEEIHHQVPGMKIEVFIRGALYMAYFGRYLFSGYINKHDPNQGTCTNARRQEYNMAEGKEDDVGNIVRKYEPIPVQIVEPTLGIGASIDKVFMVEEAKHPGEYMTAFGDEYGTYITNSKDLRAIAHVEHLTQMGVHSLKIEGHTKSFYYCMCIAQVYRRVTGDVAVGKPFDISLLETLEGLAHHGCAEDFLHRHTHDNYQNYEYGYSLSECQQFVGEFTGECNGPLVAVAVKDKLSIGDSSELMTPQGNVNFTLEHMESGRGEAMLVTPGNGYTVQLSVPDNLPLQYVLLTRNFTDQTTRDPHGNQLTRVILSRSKDTKIESHIVSIGTGITHFAGKHSS